MRSRGAEAMQNSGTVGSLRAMLGWIAASTWIILVGGGGLWLRWTKGTRVAHKRLVRAAIGFLSWYANA